MSTQNPTMTDEKILTTKIEKNKYLKYKKLVSDAMILEEIEKMLTRDEKLDDDIISLLSVANLLKNKSFEYTEMNAKYESILDAMIKDNISSSSYICIHRFNYENNLLLISFNFYGLGYVDITFSKKDNQLVILKSETRKSNEVLKCMGDVISEYYDKLLEYRDFNQDFVSNCIPINSNFFVRIGFSCVEIESSAVFSFSDFELRKNANGDYKCNCSSHNIRNIVNGNEDNIFDNIFVKIKDCPKWMQQSLKQIRQEQLEKHHKGR